MNNITKNIILGAIATTTVASLPTTVKAQQYPGFGYQGHHNQGQLSQGYPSQRLQNPGFDPYAGVNQMNQFIQQDMQRQQQQLLDMMRSTSNMQTDFYNQMMQGFQNDASQVMY